ncbi:MAG: hypothetical protein CMP08_07775 [Xanthomonadales bacterium]|nr:hypothetical protein [Xanthomonadales bacterium]
MSRARVGKHVGPYAPIVGRGFITASIAAGRYRLTEPLGLEKLCTGCGDYWPADTEFFYAKRDDLAGLSSLCKACYRERNTARKRTADGVEMA